jgi:endogenous inhibitor of DNA gyrase (YacG/DUF329 family)
MIKGRCPVCDQLFEGELRDLPYHPFCSERCRLVDLGRWLGERYRVPATESSLKSDHPSDEPTSPP